MKRKTEGFGLVEALLIIVILLLVGFIGFYVFNSTKTANKTLDSGSKANTSTSAAAAKSASSTANNTSAAGKKYLTISEWAVKIPYNLDDTVTYAINANTAGFSTVKLVASDSACTNGAAGEIIRATANEVVRDDGTTAAQMMAQGGSPAVRHIGDYYYVFVPSQAACSANGSDSVNQLQQVAGYALADGMSALEAVK